jgi:hypothetical protein
MPHSEPRPLPALTEKDIERFWSKVDRSGGPEACWPWIPPAMSDGRGQIRIGGRKGALVLAPRVAYAIGVGDPGLAFVCHRCDNPACCNPRHLYLGGYVENHADMDARGRRRINPHPGESNGTAKLNDQAVLAIRFSRAAGAPLEVLAALYRVGMAVISGVTTGRIWRHVGGPRTAGLHFTRRAWSMQQEVPPCV